MTFLQLPPIASVGSPRARRVSTLMSASLAVLPLVFMACAKTNEPDPEGTNAGGTGGRLFSVDGGANAGGQTNADGGFPAGTGGAWVSVDGGAFPGAEGGAGGELIGSGGGSNDHFIPNGVDPGPANFSLDNVEAFCSETGTGSFTAKSVEEFATAIAGRWVLCTDGSPFGYTPDEVGLELTPAGTWFKLYLSGQTYVRGTGFDEEGTYDLLDTTDFNGPGVFQLDMHILGSGTVIAHPQFTNEPRWMRINNNSVYVGDYRRVD